jgi:hypothetical protein
LKDEFSSKRGKFIKQMIKQKLKNLLSKRTDLVFKKEFMKEKYDANMGGTNPQKLIIKSI